MKKLSYIILISILSLSLSSNVFACEMSEQYKAWLNLSKEERKNAPEPAYCRDAYMNPATETTVEDMTKRVFNDPSYIKVLKDASSSRYLTPTITPVKYQGSANVCWAFTTLGMLEILAARDNFGLLDFSEKHLVYMLSNRLFTDYDNTEGYNIDVDSGGNIGIAVNYLYQAKGPVYEEQVRFDESSDPVSSNGYVGLKGDYLVDNYYIGNYDAGACTSSQLTTFKEMIYNNGSVGVSIRIYTSEPYMHNSKYLNYNGPADNSHPENHAVILVGWDDTISKSNFSGATRDGAFIAKNSWSTQFGDNGYFYISYDDVYICSDYSAFSGLSSNYYDKAYKSGKAFSNGYCRVFGDNTCYSETMRNVTTASKMTVSEASYLSRISFDAPANTHYDVYYSKDGYQANTMSNWKHLAYGDTTSEGIYTETFNDIAVEGTFYIIVDFTSSRGIIYNFYCSPKNTTSLYYDGQAPLSGRNFINYNNQRWEDMVTLDTSISYGCSNGIAIYTSHDKVMDVNSFELGTPTGTIKSGDYTSKITIPYTVGPNMTLEFEPEFNVHLDGSTTSLNDKFNVQQDSTNNKIYINVVSFLEPGTYVLDVTFDGNKKSISFSIIPDISFRTYTLKDGMIIIPLPAQLKVTYDEFISDMIIDENLGYQVVDGATVITSGNIKTGYKLKVGGATFTIVVLGDINKDGRIRSNDYGYIKNHIMGDSTITDSIAKIAADINGDGRIRSNDYGKIKAAIMN